MNRLTSGLVSSLALLVTAACSTEPTSDLSNSGAADRLVAKPSDVIAQLGVTKKVIVGALDAQGNQLNFTYEVGTVGSGLVVERDFSYLPIFTGLDASPIPPKSAAEFQFLLTATQYVSSSFTITAGGKEVVVPVKVVPNPIGTLPVAAVTSTGPNVNDPTVLVAPAPLIFSSGATVTFDDIPGLIAAVSDDGSTMTVLAPPGSTASGVVQGFVAPYAADLTPTPGGMNVAVNVSPTVPSQSATTPAAAPDIGTTNAFFDAGTFGGADITADEGVGAQYYQFTLPADAEVTITANWSDDADVDVVLCSDVTCSDGGDFTATAGEQPETGTFTLTAGTYYIAVVLFEQGSSATNPAWISVQIE